MKGRLIAFYNRTLTSPRDRHRDFERKHWKGNCQRDARTTTQTGTGSAEQFGKRRASSSRHSSACVPRSRYQGRRLGLGAEFPNRKVHPGGQRHFRISARSRTSRRFHINFATSTHLRHTFNDNKLVLSGFSNFSYLGFIANNDHNPSRPGIWRDVRV